MVRAMRQLRSEAGFTIIETLVASLILVTGLAASLAALDAASHVSHVTQRHQTAVQVAQRELEELSNLDYEQLALTATPASSSDTDSPLSRISGTQFQTESGQSEELVIEGDSAAVDPGPETLSESSSDAIIYRFVTWVDSPDYSSCTENCSNTQDYKRITVAVAAQNEGPGSGFSGYVLLSTLRVDPSQGPEGQVAQPDDPSPTQAHDNFYLYDVHASNCSSNSYTTPSDSHALHDTTGYCGVSDATYPDLMDFIQTPNPYQPNVPPLYTYSTDLSGSYDGGIALQRSPAGSGCTQTGLTEYQIHSWETDPVSSSEYDLSGKFSFDFWTATVGGNSGAGEICAWLYDREMVSGAPVDTLITNTSYSNSSWPTTPSDLSFTISHDEYTLAAGHRLHFVLTASEGSDNDLQFIYDHPSYPTFIQIRTTTPVSE